MTKPWPRIHLGEVLDRSAETVTISPGTEYREITVKLWGKGVVLRGIISGAEIAGARRFVAKAGQFILSRIDARNGATGIVPKELQGAVVTNDFPLFELNRNKLDALFLGWMSKTRDFVELCKHASEGTSAYRKLDSSVSKFPYHRWTSSGGS
jgi:type I restriction enzyme S subunit